MHYAVRSRRRVRPWAAALAVLAVVLSLGLTVAGAANGAAAQGDRARPTAERTGAPPGPATVTYVLTGALGQPLPAVRVVIHAAPDWIWMDEGVTDSAGRVTFANIPAGSVGAEGQGTLSNVDLGTTTLVAGSQTVGFEMATTHGEVSGRLANLPDQQTQDSWQVCTYDGSYGLCVPLEVPTGRYSFTGIDALPTGSYDLVLVPWMGEGGGRPIPVGHVTVTAGEAITADADLAPHVATLRGTVTDTDGSPFVGVVAASPANYPIATTTIGIDGRYEVRVLIASESRTLVEVRTSDGGVVDEADLDLAGGTTTVHDVDLQTRAWAELRGVVRDDDGAPVANASIWLCHRLGCRTVLSGVDGSYHADRIAIGPVSAYAQLEGFIGGIAHGEAATDGQVVVLDLTMRRLRALPAGVTLSGAWSGGHVVTLPRVTQPVLAIDACARGSVTYTVDFDAQAGVEFTGSLTESASTPGHYAATLPAAGTYGGLAIISLTVTCPDGQTTTKAFDVSYIDPSGTVLDTEGNPVEGARVVLQRSDAQDGPFVTVPDGSDIMSPANRVNPWTTGADGGFKWDVIAGYYRLQITAPGYHVPGSDEDVLITEVWRIPPEVVGLELVLERDATGPVEPEVTLTSPTAYPAVGQPLSLRATIAGNAGRPTGTVDFALAGAPVADCQDVAVSDGIATCTTTAARAGRVTGTAAYSGDGAYAAGSGDLTLTIAKGRQSFEVSRLATLTLGASRSVTIAMKNSGLRPAVTNATPATCRTSVRTSAATTVVTATGLRTGRCSIRLAQNGNTDWHQADATSVSWDVTAKRPRGGALEGRIAQQFARGLRTLTGIAITAGDGKDTVTAYVRTRDTSGARQGVTGLTGGGLTWHRILRTGSGGWITEVWRAKSAAPVGRLVVKANLVRSAPASSLEVLVVNAATR